MVTLQDEDVSTWDLWLPPPPPINDRFWRGASPSDVASALDNWEEFFTLLSPVLQQRLRQTSSSRQAYPLFDAEVHDMIGRPLNRQDIPTVDDPIVEVVDVAPRPTNPPQPPIPLPPVSAEDSALGVIGYFENVGDAVTLQRYFLENFGAPTYIQTSLRGSNSINILRIGDDIRHSLDYEYTFRNRPRRRPPRPVPPPRPVLPSRPRPVSPPRLRLPPIPPPPPPPYPGRYY